LAAEEECRAPLPRIYHGHSLIGMQRNYPARRKISRRVFYSGDVGPATEHPRSPALWACGRATEPTAARRPKMPSVSQ
jgi:hypothetical protein